MYYIVEPKCHGNGGWSGYKTLASSESLESLLKSDPEEDYEWEPEFSPYGSGIINEPRICNNTENPNYSAYIWNSVDFKWVEDKYPDGEVAQEKALNEAFVKAPAFFNIDTRSNFAKNCRKNRKNKAKICNQCPFRQIMEEADKEVNQKKSFKNRKA